MKFVKKRNKRRAESLLRHRRVFSPNQVGILPPRSMKEIKSSLNPILKILAPIEWLGEWVTYCFKTSAGLRLIAEVVALGVVVVTVSGFWLEYRQRGVDRGVRVATLFAQIAQVHALPDGEGLKALKPSVEALARENISMAGINLNKAVLTFADLSDAGLSGVYLKGADLSDANLSDADLSDAHLSGVYLRDADLSDAHLNGADLRDAHLSGADFSGANFSDADLRGARLTFADLSDADLKGADLRGADLSDAYLGGADLRGTYLRDADLSGARLRGADFREASLRGTDLRGADLEGSDFSGAYLSGVNFAEAKNIPSLRDTFATPTEPPKNIPEGVEIPDKWVLPD